jgi:hypothetical protein
MRIVRAPLQSPRFTQRVLHESNASGSLRKKTRAAPCSEAAREKIVGTPTIANLYRSPTHLGCAISEMTNGRRHHHRYHHHYHRQDHDDRRVRLLVDRSMELLPRRCAMHGVRRLD